MDNSWAKREMKRRSIGKVTKVISDLLFLSHFVDFYNNCRVMAGHLTIKTTLLKGLSAL